MKFLCRDYCSIAISERNPPMWLVKIGISNPRAIGFSLVSTLTLRSPMHHTLVEYQISRMVDSFGQSVVFCRAIASSRETLDR
jgi:hypothetical protein